MSKREKSEINNTRMLYRNVTLLNNHHQYPRFSPFLGGGWGGHHRTMDWGQDKVQATPWDEDVLLALDCRRPNFTRETVSRKSLLFGSLLLAAESDPGTDDNTRKQGSGGGCSSKLEPGAGGLAEGLPFLMTTLWNYSTFKTKCLNKYYIQQKITPQGIVKSAVNFNFKTKIRCVFLGRFLILTLDQGFQTWFFSRQQNTKSSWRFFEKRCVYDWSGRGI